MTAVDLVRPRGLCGSGWSLVALVLCVAAALGTLAALVFAIGRTQ